MDYKEKINEILKVLDFEEQDGKLVNQSPLCTVESSFDESGHWDLCVTVRMYNKVDKNLLEAMNDRNLIDEKFVINVFKNAMKNYEQTSK